MSQSKPGTWGCGANTLYSKSKRTAIYLNAEVKKFTMLVDLKVTRQSPRSGVLSASLCH